MDAQIDMLAKTLITVLGVFILLVLSVLVYVVWLLVEIHQEVCKRLRSPEVPRDAAGRRIKERL